MVHVAWAGTGTPGRVAQAAQATATLGGRPPAPETNHLTTQWTIHLRSVVRLVRKARGILGGDEVREPVSICERACLKEAHRNPED